MKKIILIINAILLISLIVISSYFIYKQLKEENEQESIFDDLCEIIQEDEKRFKVYNKKIESNLNILGELTRVEVSRTYEDYPIGNIVFFHFGDKFPNIYVNSYIYSLSDYNDKTLLAILYAVQGGFPISYLTKTYKQKIKNMLEGGYRIKFNEKAATCVLQQTIYFYFMKNEKVKFK